MPPAESNKMKSFRRFSSSVVASCVNQVRLIYTLQSDSSDVQDFSSQYVQPIWLIVVEPFLYTPYWPFVTSVFQSMRIHICITSAYTEY